jgi:hypothetical protein
MKIFGFLTPEAKLSPCPLWRTYAQVAKFCDPAKIAILLHPEHGASEILEESVFFFW